VALLDSFVLNIRKRQFRMNFMQLNLKLVKQTFPRGPVFSIKGEELSIVLKQTSPKIPVPWLFRRH
jgi:hypothetical protein